MRCYYCQRQVNKDIAIINPEDHQDGVYCDDECLYQQLRDEEDQNYYLDYLSEEYVN